MLDACRDNPLARQMRTTGPQRSVGRGLAAVEVAVGGTIIAFATAAGQTADDGAGRNSPYTTALLEHIATPGLEVRQMLTRVRVAVARATGNRQIPWENGAPMGDIYLAGLPPEPAPPPAPTASPVPDAAAIAWEVVAGLPDGPAKRRALTHFLADYPESAYAGAACALLAALDDDAPGERVQEALLSPPDQPPPPATAEPPAPSPPPLPPEAVEAALGLDRQSRVLVQRALADLGHAPGPADGAFGPRTRAAIQGFQRATGAEPTGYLRPSEAEHLIAHGGEVQVAVGITEPPTTAAARSWDRTFGGSRSDGANALAVLPDGGLAVAGWTASKGAGGSDMWVLRLAADGSLLWDRTFGGGQSDGATALAALPDGGLAVAGLTMSKGAGGDDMWVLRLDDQGR